MVIKLYISGISGNKEVKKKQQRVQMILDSKQINYEAIDITEPGKEKDKEFMQQNGKVRESLGKHPLPPQIFNDDDFCGDYEDFDMANEVDELEKFLHIETKDMENGSKQNEKSSSNASFFGENKDSTDSLYNPYEYHTLTIKKDGVRILNMNVNGLKEEITDINSLVGEKESTDEITKSEVNGESETVANLEPSNDSVETLDDAGDPEKEEFTEKNETADAENEKEENAEDEDKEHKVDAEMPEKEDENEDVENPGEDKGESSEKSEEKEEVKEEVKEEEKEEKKEEEKEKEKEEEKEEKEKEEENVESKEKVESEEEESDRESPESEKSQEE